jgi:hypothetical protein
MAKKRPRFHRLRQALKLAGGTVDPSSALHGYQQFTNGKTHITVTNPVSSANRKRNTIALLPFGFTNPTTPVAADHYESYVTVYSNAGRNTLTIAMSQLGWTAIAVGNQQNPDYYPSKLIVFVPSGPRAAAANPSGVTGLAYKRTPGASYSLPFGRGGTASSDEEETRRYALSTLAKAGDGETHKATSVTFQPEYFAPASTDLTALTIS